MPKSLEAPSSREYSVYQEKVQEYTKDLAVIDQSLQERNEQREGIKERLGVLFAVTSYNNDQEHESANKEIRDLGSLIKVIDKEKDLLQKKKALIMELIKDLRTKDRDTEAWLRSNKIRRLPEV